MTEKWGLIKDREASRQLTFMQLIWSGLTSIFLNSNLFGLRYLQKPPAKPPN